MKSVFTLLIGRKKISDNRQDLAFVIFKSAHVNRSRKILLKSTDLLLLDFVRVKTSVPLSTPKSVVKLSISRLLSRLILFLIFCLMSFICNNLDLIAFQ